MDASVRYRESVAIVGPVGHVVLGDGEETFRAAIHRALDHGASSILVDFRHVDMLDSSGIGALLAAQRTVSGRGGEIKLVHLPARVHEVLQITEVLSLFDVFEDEGDALESFGGSSVEGKFDADRGTKRPSRRRSGS